MLSELSDEPAHGLARSILARYGAEAMAKIDSIIREAEEDGDLVGSLQHWRQTRSILAELDRKA